MCVCRQQMKRQGSSADGEAIRIVIDDVDRSRRNSATGPQAHPGEGKQSAVSNKENNNNPPQSQQQYQTQQQQQQMNEPDPYAVKLLRLRRDLDDKGYQSKYTRYMAVKIGITEILLKNQ